MPLIGAPDPTVPAPRSERNRRLMWFGVAVGLHAALLLGFWLMPPLRLKWGPPPEDWVPVTSLPKPAQPTAPDAASAGGASAPTLPAPKKPAAAKAKLRAAAAASTPAPR